MKQTIKVIALLFATLFAANFGNKASAQDILDSLYDESSDAELSDSLSMLEEDASSLAEDERTDSLLTDLYNELQDVNTVTECEPLQRNPTFSDKVYRERLKDMRTVIKMTYNSTVRAYINKYAGRLRASTSAMLGASNFYMPAFEAALEAQQVPLELRFLPIIESGLNPRATSPAGAAGLWQFMASTGRRLGLEINSLVDERRDLEKSSYAAAEYLKKLYDIFHDWTLVIAGYNCGPGTISKAIKRSGGKRDYWQLCRYLPRETQSYVPAFIATNYIMTYYCEHGICPVESRLPSGTDTIMLSRRLYFNQIAKATGASLQLIKKLNPQYRANLIPGSRSNPCSLRLPMKYLSKLLQLGEGVYDQDGDEDADEMLEPAEDGLPTDILDLDDSEDGLATPSIEEVDPNTPKESATPKPATVINTSDTPAKKVPASGE